MDIFNLADDTVLISAINNKWKSLFRTDNLKFSHYIRSEKRQAELTAAMMLMQTQRWRVLYQIRYLGFTSDTLKYLKKDGYRLIITYLTNNRVSSNMGYWLCQKIKYSITENIV